MANQKIKLNILGISYSQTQTGAYALILEEEHGGRRLPIIIGGMEAQAIAIRLEGLNPSRPLTHDLMTSLLGSFNIRVVEVNITKLEEGIFYSELVCDDGQKRITLDSRTSDAVAMAMRFNSPIYTTSAILEKAGIRMEPQVKIAGDQEDEDEHTDPLEKLSLDELRTELDKAIRDENYEYASKVRDQIKKIEEQ